MSLWEGKEKTVRKGSPSRKMKITTYLYPLAAFSFVYKANKRSAGQRSRLERCEADKFSQLCLELPPCTKTARAYHKWFLGESANIRLRNASMSTTKDARVEDYLKASSLVQVLSTLKSRLIIEQQRQD